MVSRACGRDDVIVGRGWVGPNALTAEAVTGDLRASWHGGLGVVLLGKGSGGHQVTLRRSQVEDSLALVRGVVQVLHVGTNEHH